MMGARRTFEGQLLPPGDNGRASWTLENPENATLTTSDEDWFAWSLGKHVRITVERIANSPQLDSDDASETEDSGDIG